MSSVHIKMYKMNGCNEKTIEDLADTLKMEMDAELVAESRRNPGEAKTILLSFERFFFRNGSYAGLTIMLTEYGNMQTADIIGFGGGEGIFNISLGANSKLANTAAKLLLNCDFRQE